MNKYWVCTKHYNDEICSTWKSFLNPQKMFFSKRGYVLSDKAEKLHGIALCSLSSVLACFEGYICMWLFLLIFLDLDYNISLLPTSPPPMIFGNWVLGNLKKESFLTDIPTLILQPQTRKIILYYNYTDILKVTLRYSIWYSKVENKIITMLSKSDIFF